jgi:sugar phosphate isomerase/epimerase
MQHHIEHLLGSGKTMSLSRRGFARLAGAMLPAAPAFAGANTFYKGVQFGVCSYSFRGMGLDELIRQMAALPMGQLELESVFIEPENLRTADQRDALRQWRLTVSLDSIRAVRRRLDDAGIDVCAFNIPVTPSFTEAELDRVFTMARLLGAPAVNTATTLPVVPMLASMAERHNVRVGLHPTANQTAPGAIGSGASYREALAISPFIGANPDLNGWRLWGKEPVAFLTEIGPRITTLHTHDSRPAEPRAQAVPFGQGANPIRAVLQAMRKEKLTFVSILERTWNLAPGEDNVAALRQCIQYCRAALDE